MPCLLFIIILIVFLWLQIRVRHFGRRLSPLAAFKLMENRKPTIVINLSQPIVVKPAAETITVRPMQRQAIVVKPSSVIVIQPKTVDVITVQPSQTLTVTPPERGAWDERGWTQTSDGGHVTYQGYFSVGTRQFRGRIEARNRGRDITVYIYNPPREIKHHPHGACFQLVGDDWFILHWARPARNVDDAILYLERVLDESLNG